MAESAKERKVNSKDSPIIPITREVLDAPITFLTFMPLILKGIIATKKLT